MTEPVHFLHSYVFVHQLNLPAMSSITGKMNFNHVNTNENGTLASISVSLFTPVYYGVAKMIRSWFFSSFHLLGLGDRFFNFI